LYAACALVAAPLAAQDTVSAFDHLQGAWHGTGTLMGRDARSTMTWRMSDGFAILTFANGFAAPDGQITPVLNAVAVYRTSPATPEAVWLDSRGVRIDIAWEASDSTLVAHWTAPTEAGRTTYRVRSADAIEVVDEVQSGNSWRTFGTARYRRERSAGG
jgi:hypothetical protein